MLITYKEISFEADLPEVMFLRHNPLTKETIHAVLNAEDYTEDPDGMYEYSEFNVDTDPVAAFHIFKSFIANDTDVYTSEWFAILEDTLILVLKDNDAHTIRYLCREKNIEQGASPIVIPPLDPAE